MHLLLTTSKCFCIIKVFKGDNVFVAHTVYPHPVPYVILQFYNIISCNFVFVYFEFNFYEVLKNYCLQVNTLLFDLYFYHRYLKVNTFLLEL